MAAVVLAAGAGTRFVASGGVGHKLLAPLRGRTVVEWAIRHVLQAGLDQTYVVVGAVDIPIPPGAVPIQNDDWDQGIATSLRAAITSAEYDGCDALVVGLGDQPLVQPEAWRRLAATDAPIAVATYDGRRGNPVRLSAEVWPLLPVTGDEGARLVMRQRPDLVAEVPCPGDPTDIDTQGDLPAAEIDPRQ